MLAAALTGFGLFSSVCLPAIDPVIDPSPGGAAERVPLARPIWVPGAHPAGTVFVDLDGRKDFVVGNGSSFHASLGAASYALLDSAFGVRSSGALWPSAERGLVTHPVLLAGDLDGDGFPDLVAISDKGRVSVQRSSGRAIVASGRDRFFAPSTSFPLRIMNRRRKGFWHFQSMRASSS